MFREIGAPQLAAKCLYSANEVEKAAQEYEDIGEWQYAARCWQNIPGKERKAAENWVQAGSPIKALSWYRRCQAWQEALELVQQFA